MRGKANKEKVDNGTKVSAMQSVEHPEDLLLRFLPQENLKDATQLANYKQADVNLGLSLGGIYTEDSKETLLVRSSSITSLLTMNTGSVKVDASLPRSYLSLSRPSSLPIAAEKEHRKAIFMELVRSRMERESNTKEITGKERLLALEPMPSSQSKIPAWAAASAANSPALCRAIFKIKMHAALSGSRRLEGLAAENDANSSQTLPKENNEEAKVRWEPSVGRESIKCAGNKLENRSKKAKVSHNGFQHNGMDVMRQMPSVTTTGDGPNGRRIEGFLYKYRKGEVRIVCVCHGSFLTPAEFVKHAGGKDVSNPMKHITVCSSPFFF